MAAVTRVPAVLACLAVVNLGVLLAQAGQQGRQTSVEHWDCPDQMHASFVARFTASPGFGVSRMPSSLMIDRSGWLDLGEATYAVDRVELIGLLGEEPAAYVLGGHAPGPRFPGITSRDLTPFERSAVAAVQRGGVLCDSPTASSDLACVGAIPLEPACIACHQDRKPGDVIGAFSYRLKANGRRLARR